MYQFLFSDTETSLAFVTSLMRSNAVFEKNFNVLLFKVVCLHVG